MFAVSCASTVTVAPDGTITAQDYTISVKPDGNEDDGPQPLVHYRLPVPDVWGVIIANVVAPLVLPVVTGK